MSILSRVLLHCAARQGARHFKSLERCATHLKYFHVSSCVFNKRSHYEVLGVQKNASDKEIKTAYFNLAKKYHPDTNPGDPNSAKKFQEVSEAYNILSNADSRKNYDFFGNSDFQQRNPFSSHRKDSQYTGNTNYQYYYRNQVSPEEAAKMFQSILKEFEKMSRQPNFVVTNNSKYAQKHPIRSAIINKIINFFIGAVVRKVINNLGKKHIRQK